MGNWKDMRETLAIDDQPANQQQQQPTTGTVMFFLSFFPSFNTFWPSAATESLSGERSLIHLANLHFRKHVKSVLKFHWMGKRLSWDKSNWSLLEAATLNRQRGMRLGFSARMNYTAHWQNKERWASTALFHQRLIASSPAPTKPICTSEGWDE